MKFEYNFYALICLILALCNQPAQSAEIGFEGEIVRFTCSLKINGITGSLSINLPPVKVAEFGGHDSKVVSTIFTGEIYGCSQDAMGGLNVVMRPFKMLVPGIGGYPGGQGRPFHYLGNMATVNAAKGVHFYIENEAFGGGWQTEHHQDAAGNWKGVLFNTFRPGQAVPDMVKRARVSYVRDMTPESGSQELVTGIVQSALEFAVTYD